MCTLSWLLEEGGYQVFFNRDEQRSRAEAIPASFHIDQKAIFPIDPQGGGTWIALTESGASFCLLNNYQAQTLYCPENPISRGQIILSLLAVINKLAKRRPHDILELCQQLPLVNLSPFTLCYFPEDLNLTNNDVIQIDWDGEQLISNTPSNPFTSSGFKFSIVSEHRYRAIDGYDLDQAGLVSYHSSHQPQASPYSVCMHREDAKTVSFCHISVGNEKRVRYFQGSPCQSTMLVDADNKALTEVVIPT